MHLEECFGRHVLSESPCWMPELALVSTPPGLDAAGKTTILYKLHIGEVLSTVPTIGKHSELEL